MRDICLIRDACRSLCGISLAQAFEMAKPQSCGCAMNNPPWVCLHCRMVCNPTHLTCGEAWCSATTEVALQRGVMQCCVAWQCDGERRCHATVFSTVRWGAMLCSAAMYRTGWPTFAVKSQGRVRDRHSDSLSQCLPSRRQHHSKRHARHCLLGESVLL